MKPKIFLLIFALMIILSSFALAELECAVRQTSCLAGEAKILGLTNYTNAHVELPEYSSPDHNYHLCCKDNEAVYSINASCGAKLLGLSNWTNAHVEKSDMSSPDYSYYSACIDADNVSITCSYTSGSCPSVSTCVLTLNESMPNYPDTNMHAASCIDSPFEEKLCCGFSGCIDSDEDGWGASGSDLSQCNYTASYDCNDGNAGIHPNAYDIPNNGIDEDCSGADAYASYDAKVYFEGETSITPWIGYYLGDDVYYEVNFFKNNVSSDEDVVNIVVNLTDVWGKVLKSQTISYMAHPNTGIWTGMFTTQDISSQDDDKINLKIYVYNSGGTLLDWRTHGDEFFKSGTIPSFIPTAYTYFTNAVSNYTVKDLAVNSSLGKVDWSGSTLDLHERNIDLDSALTIGDRSAYIDSAAYSELNDSAILTFENVDCSSPYVFYSETATTRADILTENKQCLAPRCADIECAGNTLTVTVSSFTGYAAEADASLTIDADDPKLVGAEVHFTADYRNVTDNIFIDGATCTIYFTDGNYSMAEGAVYTYNRTFVTEGLKNYNVTCSKTGFSTLTAFDNATITSAEIPEFSILTLGFGLVAVLVGLIIIRRKNER